MKGLGQSLGGLGGVAVEAAALTAAGEDRGAEDDEGQQTLGRREHAATLPYVAAMTVEITLFTDPACPFAFSAEVIAVMQQPEGEVRAQFGRAAVPTPAGAEFYWSAPD